MREEFSCTNNLILILMPLICFFFVYLDATEIYKITDNWNYGINNLNSNIFEECVKYPIITRIGFTFFSFLLTVSAFILSLFVAIDIEFFISKILKTFIHMNYVIFGPYMLGICVLAITSWDKTLYHCDIDMNYKKVFSFVDLFNLTLSLSISIFITFGMEVYSSFTLYFDSITRRREGSKILRNIFFYFTSRNGRNRSNRV